MDYSKLVAVTGLPGLFLLAGNKADGIIVKNLEDGSIKFISSRKEKFTQLEGIEVYTVKENVSLSEIFLAMKQSGEPLPSEKDPKALKTYFEKVYPDLDFDRVYGSDMKKMVRWFAVIKQHGITIKVAEETPEEEETTDTPAE
jgi:hypothetical protein